MLQQLGITMVPVVVIANVSRLTWTTPGAYTLLTCPELLLICMCVYMQLRVIGDHGQCHCTLF